MFKKLFSIFTAICFALTTLGPITQVYAQSVLDLPKPGTMVNLSPTFEPVLVKGLKINQENPFLFDFIVDSGDALRHSERSEESQQEFLKQEADRLIKYFFAGLTIPEKDLWVNLSPYEKDRTVPESLSKTALGRDLLAQDYILKQLTATLIYPEKELGKAFWDKVYTKAQQMYGTSEVPVNTFNKVWIVADKATVFERNQVAYVLEGHLKVMLEEDYLAKEKGGVIAAPLSFPNASVGNPNTTKQQSSSALASQIVRDIILPELEKEVNQGKNFAPLRQMYYSLILAGWFKNNLKQAVLNQVYSDKSVVKGLEYNPSVILSEAKDPKRLRNSLAMPQTDVEAIYQQYLQAYKKGVFNYIKEDAISSSNANILSSPNASVGDLNKTTTPRKYFSGGMTPAVNPKVVDTLTFAQTRAMASTGGLNTFSVNTASAMTAVGAHRFNNGLEAPNSHIFSIVNMMIETLKVRGLVVEGSPYSSVTYFLDVREDKERLKIFDGIVSEIEGFRFNWFIKKTTPMGAREVVEDQDFKALGVLLENEERRTELFRQLEAIKQKVSLAMNSIIGKPLSNWGQVKGVFLFSYRLPGGQKRFIFAGGEEVDGKSVGWAEGVSEDAQVRMLPEPFAQVIKAGGSSFVMKKNTNLRQVLTPNDLDKIVVFEKDGNGKIYQVQMNEAEQNMFPDLKRAVFEHTREGFDVEYDYGNGRTILKGIGGPFTIMNDFNRILALHIDEEIGHLTHSPNEEDIYFGTKVIPQTRSQYLILQDGQVRVDFDEGVFNGLVIYRQGEDIFVKEDGKVIPIRLVDNLRIELPNGKGTNVFTISQRGDNPNYLSILNETQLPIIVTYNKPAAAMVTPATTDVEMIKRLEGYMREASPAAYPQDEIDLVMQYVQGKGDMVDILRTLRGKFFRGTGNIPQDQRDSRQKAQWLLDAAWLTAAHRLSKEQFLALRSNLESMYPDLVMQAIPDAKLLAQRWRLAEDGTANIRQFVVVNLRLSPLPAVADDEDVGEETVASYWKVATEAVDQRLPKILDQMFVGFQPKEQEQDIRGYLQGKGMLKSPEIERFYYDAIWLTLKYDLGIPPNALFRMLRGVAQGDIIDGRTLLINSDGENLSEQDKNDLFLDVQLLAKRWELNVQIESKKAEINGELVNRVLIRALEKKTLLMGQALKPISTPAMAHRDDKSRYFAVKLPQEGLTFSVWHGPDRKNRKKVGLTVSVEQDGEELFLIHQLMAKGGRGITVVQVDMLSSRPTELEGLGVLLRRNGERLEFRVINPQRYVLIHSFERTKQSSRKRQAEDRAQRSTGGIDLMKTTQNTAVQKEGEGVQLKVDPAMINRILKAGTLDRLDPVIYRVTPITSLWPILGLEPPKREEERLAGV